MSLLRRLPVMLFACLSLLSPVGDAMADSPREGRLQLTAELNLPPTMPAPVADGETPPPLVQQPRDSLVPPPRDPLMQQPRDPLVSGTALALPASSLPPPALPLREDLPRIPTIDLTTPADDLLQRMRNGFSMPDLNGPLVAERQAWYLNNPTYIKRVLDRSKRYMHYIIGELEKRGMPTELALLPIVESSYNPLAYSRAKALGMWQFIPSTGKSYKLEQNWWMDERRDVIASTAAALDYLQAIYEMHGDWHLALASYNWGEGSVARAIAKNRAKGLPTDYMSLDMPGETRYYVPKLQAIKNIIAQPELFGLKLDPMPNRPYFATVEKPGDMDVSLAAQLAEIPVDEFIALNPAYQRPVIPGKSRTPLVLPADKVATFRLNLETHEANDRPLSAWKTYTLKKGDKLDKLADRHDISLSRLKQLNGIGPRTKVGPGFTLLIPGKDAPRDSQLAALDAKLPDAPAEPAGKGKSGKSAKGGKGSGKESRNNKTEAKGKNGKAAKSAGKPAKDGGKSKAGGKATAKSSSKPAAKSVGKSPAKPAKGKHH